MVFNTLSVASRIVFGLGWFLLLFLSQAASAANQKDFTYLDPKYSAAKYIGCLDNQKVTMVSAHRGGIHPGFPENALESMQAAVAYGPMLLEVDVRETADGQLVLLHDNTLERTTNGKGELTDYTLEQLRYFRLVDKEGVLTNFSIPTLDKVLKWADNRAIVQLDVKRGVDVTKVARAVVDAGAVDSTLIIAYRLEDAIAALNVNEQLSFSISISDIQDLKALDAAGVPREQIVAWTGVVNELGAEIWPILEALDIPSSAGALWRLEETIIQSGNTEPYIKLAESGVDVIAADHYRLAFNTLSSKQDLYAALIACKGV